LADAKTTISFNRGVPSLDSFPIAQIQECAQAILEADGATLLQYGKPYGYPPLREHIAAWYDANATQVCLSNGSLQILSFISALLLQPGDTVFVEQPTYDRTIATFRRYQANVVGIPLHEDGPDLEFLSEQLQTVTPKFFYAIPDFQNPSGVTVSLAKREAVLRLADEHDFWVVEDAPYRSLRYKGSDVPSMRSLRPDRVLHMSSFTKLLSPGIRVGYLIAPQEILEAMAPIVANTYVCPGLLSEGIVYEFCRRGWLAPNIEKLKQLYGAKLEATLNGLQQHLPQAQWIRPEGGYFVGVTLPEGSNIADLLGKAPAAGLSLSDGRGFFAQGGGDRFLRLAFPALSVDEIGEGLARLATII